MKTLSHTINTRYLCLLFSLLLVLNIPGLAAAQSSPTDRELFDFPDAVDLYFAYHTGSDQAIVVVPAAGVSIMVVDTTPFEQIDQSALDPSNWQTVDSVDLWPGETVVLRCSAGILYKLTYSLVSGIDMPRIQVTYAPVPPTLPDPSPPASGELAFYDALDLDTGDTFTDPTVASVILCDAGPPPTPTPGPGVIPEPGTGLLLLLGLLGLLGSWLLARRGKPTPVPSQEGNIGGRSVRFWSRRDACAPRQGKWWLFLLLLSIALLSVSGADYLIAQQSCTVTVEKQGSGSGHVIGRGIDCGPDCTVSPLEAGVSPGDVITLKAIPDDGSVFVEWLVEELPYQEIFRMSGDTTMTAVFEEIPNDPPLAENDAYRTAEDVELQISAPGVLDNDSDPDGDPISAILVSGPSHGSLTLNPDGSFTYQPDPGFFGSDQFIYRATDGDLESADATVTITVNPVNEPPIAGNDAYSTDEDVELQIPAPGVLSNDSDPDGDPLNAAIVNDPSHGSLTLNPDGSCVYLPDADFHGIDQFVYRATDGELESAVAAVTITVTSDNDAPVAVDDTYQVVFNQLFYQATPGVTANDTDRDGDPLTVTLVHAVAHGSLELFPDGSFAYQPEDGYVGPDTFVYTLSDGQTDSLEATVSLHVQQSNGRTYTLDADFAEGHHINVADGSDQLRITDEAEVFDFLWVASSGTGHVVKINTRTTEIAGIYRSAPDGQPKNPSRTTVDYDGNMWVGNRGPNHDGNSVTKIGLVENGQCVDRNGDGVITTSTGLHDALPWPNTGGADTEGGVSTAVDECILHYVRTSSFGVRHVSVNADNNVWVSGRSYGGGPEQIFDLIDGQSGQILRTEGPVGYGGYGGLIDPKGILWSAAPLLRWDPDLPLSGPNGLSWQGYNHPSYGLCIDPHGNVWNTAYSGGYIRKFAPDGTLLGIYEHGGSYAKGCAVDQAGHVWVAHAESSKTVGHLLNDGTFVGNVTIREWLESGGATGLAVDSAGKIWVPMIHEGVVKRIDPSLGPIGADGKTPVGAVDYKSPGIGSFLYNYSDMTGLALAEPPNQGTWSVIFDSRIEDATWGRIDWHGRRDGDGDIRVQVASSPDNTTFSAPVAVCSGDSLAVPNGRYLRIEVRFTRSRNGASPVLEDLTVGTLGYPMPTISNTPPVVDAGEDRQIAFQEQVVLDGQVTDDCLVGCTPLQTTWQVTEGPGSVVFADADTPQTTATFSVPGVYHLRLRADDGEYQRDDSLIVTVAAADLQIEHIDVSATEFDEPSRTLSGSARVTIRNTGDAPVDLPFRVSVGTQPPLSDPDLVGEWLFRGDARDSSGHNHHGVVLGAELAPDRFGQAANAYAFDGYDDAIQIAHHPDLLLVPEDGFTLNLWLKTDGQQFGSHVQWNERWYVPIHKAAGTEGDTSWGLAGYMKFPMKQFEFELSSSQGRCAAQIPDSWIRDARWHQVTVTVQGENVRYYRDGQLQQSLTCSTTIPTLSVGPLVIGKLGMSNSRSFHGVVDDVRLYRRALSDDEITALFQQESPAPLGTLRVGESLPAGANRTVTVPLAGQVSFRDQPLIVVVDSDREIREQDETNNTARSGPQPGSEDYSASGLHVPNSPAGLVAEWLFQGNAQDSSGHDYHGQVSGAVLAPDRFGNPEGAYAFDSYRDHIIVENHPDLRAWPDAGYTVELWLKTASGFTGTFTALRTRNDSWHMQGSRAGDYYSFSLRQQETASYCHVSTASPLIQLDAWQHVALVVRGDSLRLYLDGLLQAEATCTALLLPPDDGFLFGGQSVYTGFYGLLDDIRIYHRALSSEEIWQRYQAPATASLRARIGNAGDRAPSAPVNVAFYQGNPAEGGILLGTTHTSSSLPPGAYEDVGITWTAPPEGHHTLYVVADDDGSGQGRIVETDEVNNISSAVVGLWNLTPRAHAGESQQVLPGAVVSLDGSRSYDPQGNQPLSYQWTFRHRPVGSTAALSDPTAASPMFTADQPGTYDLELTVTNTLGLSSAPDQVLITAALSTPPTVTITSPLDGETVEAGQPLTISADAADSDGTVMRVAFYLNGVLLGQDSSSPYTFGWTPDTTGVHRLTAVATDDFGATSTSDPVDLSVIPNPNRPPEITSTPSVTVEHETTFSYDVEATDPDNDPLTFSLTEAPTGMTIEANTGLITWTPTLAQVGAHPVRVIVEDGQGAGASQSFTIHVTQPQSGNQFAPSITSIPSHVVILGDTYSYDVEATDGDGDLLTYSLSMAPSGMTIDANTGLITWTPTGTQLGMHDVTVLVDDERGGIGGQYFNILVQEPNQPPTVSIGYPTDNQQVRVGDTVTIQAQATDADGSVTRIEFFLGTILLGEDTTAPYEIDWTPADTNLGQQTLTATAYDNEDASATSDPITVEVLEALPDTEPPIIEITVNPEHIVLGDDVNIQITILDDSPITDITLKIDGTPVPIVDNQATYTSQSTGFHTVTVTATDSAGNTGTGSKTFGVYSGTDTTPPEVDLDDDVEFECVELAADLYDIIGSVSDDNEVHYKLLSREKGVSVWDTLVEGTAALPLPGGVGVGFPTGVLTSFDPTIYRNGIHEIRLWAEDTAGNEASVDGCLLLDGRFKVGQATIGGIDFNIPQLGYPLLVGRVYDSRDREGGGFGNGWSMPHEASNVQADFTYDPAQNWDEEERGGWMKTYYLISRDRKLVVLRLGDGAVFKFRMDVSPKSSFLYPILNNASFPMTVSYIPVENTTGTLEALNVDPEVYLFSGGVLASWDGEAYNPNRFKLTLEDGTVYVFDKYQGLLSITDPYGHAISYSEDAITHSSGASLSIERDTSNRIEYIRDQLGRTVEYQYDEDGMLTKVIQHGEGPYPMRVLEAMGYQKGIFERPVLKDIIAPDGTRLGTFEYDSSGRKTALIDHNGNRVLFGYDASSHEYTVTDRRGNPTSYTYDSDGNVTSITDAEGSTETYTYDADGNVLAKTNKLGYTNSFTYDADGNVLSETDPLGNMVTFTYDSQGNRLSVTDPLGNTTELTYDAYGNPLTTTDALGNTSSLVYDADGLMRSTTDALNNTTTYDYDGQGNMTTKTDPLGNSVEFTYDLYGNVVESKDEMGNVTQREYDPEGYVRRIVNALGHEITKDYHHTGKVTAYTDPAGKVTHNVFDPNGNLLSNTDPDGSTFYFEYDENEQPTITTTSVTTVNGVETIRLEKVYDTLNRVTEQIDADGLSTKAEYDALGRQTAKIDKLGNRSEETYDPRNLPIRSVGPDGSEEINTYDAAGRLTSKTDALGRTTQHEYDAVGNVKKVLSPDGTWVENDYDALGRLIGTASSTGLTTSQKYDAAGRLIEETDALRRTTTYEYYPDGKRKKMIDPRGNEFTFDYDESGSQTAMHFPDGSSVTYDYNEQGENISETDQLGHTTYFEWNDLGLLQKITDPLLHETSYEYNEIGNLISQTDANGHTTTFAYNKIGRRIGKTYPLGMSQSISYDVANRTTSVMDFNGETTVSEYDQLGRLIKTDFQDGSSMTYTYTTSGQIETVTDSRGTTRYEYDSEARLARRIDPDGTEISYGYDTLGRRTSVTVPSGTTTYTYDEYGRLETVTDPDGMSLTRYTYDAHGNKESVIYPNGIITEYGYDNLNRLTSVETRTLMSDIIASYVYTLNAKGQRTKVEERVGTQLVRTIEYTYDEVDRLIEEKIDDVITGVRTISYTYDPVGNRLTKDENGVITTYDYDDNDRLLTEGGYTYGYDNNGNLLSKTGNGEQYDFTYNALNQLAHADIDTGGSSSSVDYVYDHDGIRVGKTINGTDVIKYVVDKNRPYAQVFEEQWTNDSLSATTSYVYGDALISRTTNGMSHFYHYDGMGSTRTLTDITGAVTDTYQYDAYGLLLDKTGSTINPYLYRGEQYDDDLSSYYLRARYYQPGIGRFLTTDPVEGFPTEPLRQHRYVYGNCNPVSMIDPSGKLSLIEEIGTAAIVTTCVGLAGASALGFLDDWYEKYGDLLPDAFVFGASGSPYILNVFKWLLKKTGDWSYLHYRNWGGGTVGVEVLFSVSSAQIGLYWYGGATWMKKETKIIPTSIYKGWVWNLWNLEDYKGPFITVNIGPVMLFCNGWPWFFWSGPYGAGYGFSPFEKFSGTSKFSVSLTGYKGLLPGMFKNYDDEGEIVSKIIGVQIVFATIHACYSIAQGGDGVPIFAIPIEASLAFMAGRAKRIWNRAHNIKLKSEEGDSPGTLYRQKAEGRPKGWRSGFISQAWNLAIQLRNSIRK